MIFTLIFNSVILGVGLAMDAFSVSLANGLSEPDMKKRKMILVAGIFAFFQLLMPLIGWVCVSTVAKQFEAFEKAIPLIALIILTVIGSKMLIESFGKKEEEDEVKKTGLAALLIQGIATSIDALSVGFTIAGYNWSEAMLACAIIGVVTLAICLVGVTIGKKAGDKLSGKAGILGGAILIVIGIEIFVTSLF